MTTTSSEPASLEPGAGPIAETGLAFLRRNALVDSAGVAFRDFRRTLTPRYGLVWVHIAMGYLALALTGAAVVLTADLAPPWLRVGVAALLIGFWQAFIQLFFHEAAHYNIAPDRRRNDRLANLFVGALHGLEIDSYRAVHFEHHRKLGTTMDSEPTYFDPLNMRFFARALLGIKAIEVLTNREALRPHLPGMESVSRARVWRQRLLAAAIHGTVIGGALLTRQWALALAWAIGTVNVLPLFVALRALLEHRSEGADPHADYSTQAHGEVHRLFGDGPVASTLGGAGFNRHLLHHWEPQISYTRLPELERYLDDTAAAEQLDRRRGTYWQTFWALISW